MVTLPQRSDPPGGCRRGCGGRGKHAAHWKREPGGHSTNCWAVPSHSDLFLRVLEHFHGFLHLPFLIALLQQPVTGSQVAQELQGKTVKLIQPCRHGEQAPLPPPRDTPWGDMSHHHPAGSHLMLSQGGLSICRIPSGRQHLGPPSLSQGGNGNKVEGGQGANQTCEHLRRRAMASRLQGEAEPVPVG